MKDLTRILKIENITRIFQEGQNIINGSTKFIYNDTKEYIGLFVIEINKDTTNCTLSVFSDNEGFRDVVTRNILKLIASS